MAFIERLRSWDWGPFDEPPSPSVEETVEQPNPLHTDPRKPHDEVVQVEKDIARMEEELARLRLQRLQVLGDNALITRVPGELLARVFELGTHENHNLPQTISLVSRHWRQLALDTPALWSYVKLDHEWNYGRGTEFLRKTKLYTTRAANARLSIDLDFRYSESLNESRTLLEALAPHLCRCFYFRVSVPDWDWMGIVRDGCAKLGSALEELAVRIDPTDSDDASPVALFPDGTVFPRLHVVTLEQAPLICVRAEAPALRRFAIVRDPRYHNSRIRLPLRDFIGTIAAAPRLTDVRLQATILSTDGSEPIFCGVPELTSLPNLTDLAIAHVDAAYVCLFFESVDLPALRRLSVHMDSSSPAEDCLGWLARIAIACGPRLPSLRFLELRNCSVDGSALAHLVRALHCLPQLTGLGVMSPPSGHVGSKLFDLLAGGPAVTGSWLLPHLEVLSVLSCRDVSGHELLRLVQAREGVAPGKREVSDIRVLRIAPCYQLDAEIVEALRMSVELLQII